MVYLTEQKEGRLSVFWKIVENEKGYVISQRKVEYPMYQFKKGNSICIILYNDMMEPIQEVYEYLNVYRGDDAYNSRHTSASALRLLYCFLSLTNYKIDELHEKEVTELIRFLRGVNFVPEKYGKLTQRSNATVNGYMAIYRMFFKHMNIKCDPLFEAHETSMLGNSVAAQMTSVARYNKNLTVSPHKNDGVPKYISVDDFRKIYTLMTEANDEQSCLIVHLMFGYGLRLGEVLGITSEDITEIEQDKKLVPVIYLRNRISDQKFQYCKGLPHVSDPKQYGSKDYRQCTEKIIITYSLYEELIDFLNENHAKMYALYPENYKKGFADIVSQKNKPDYNHYVFLNTYGKVLSDQVWNYTIKRYFELAGIYIDCDVRENNLSHRFRHGFAMFHARFSEHPVDVLTLQKMLRHHSLNSTMVYYNPTSQDEYEIKTEFQEELYNMIPKLKGDFSNAYETENVYNG